MDWSTADEVRDQLGVRLRRMVDAYKKDEEIDGHRIETKKTEDGRMWRAVPADQADETAEESAEEEPFYEEPTDEESEGHLLDESGVHGRTVNALKEYGVDSADQILGVLDGEDSRDDAVRMLADVDGVGKTGAGQVMDWLEEVGVWELEERAYPAWVFDTPEDERSAAKAAVDAVRADGEIPAVDGLGLDAKQALEQWLVDRNDDIDPKRIRCPECDSVQLEAPIRPDASGKLTCSWSGCGETFWLEVDGDGYHVFDEDPNILIEIRCPHCGDLFDLAPPEAYESGAARCEDDGPVYGGYEPGDCGKLFYLESTIGGYKTHEEPPPEDRKTKEPEDEDGQEAEPHEMPDDDEPRPNSPGDIAQEYEEDTESSGADDEPMWPDEDDDLEAADPSPLVPVDERPHPDLPECRSLGAPEHGTDEWHGLRARGIGSSDVAGILGLSDHADREEVWATKVEDEEVHDKPWLKNYADFGTWFERYIREWCAREHGADILPGEDLGTLQSARWEYALANIDGLDVSSAGVIEEIKTTEDEWDAAPAGYRAQVQHQMLVTGAREARIRQFVSPVPRDLIPSLLEQFRGVCLVPDEADRALADWLLDQGEVHTWIVERDDEFIARMVNREKDFWGYVQDEQPPPPADPEGTVDLSDEPEVLAAVDRLAQAEAKKEDVEDIISEADDAKDAARDAIEEKVALLDGDPKRLTVGDHKATYVERYSGYWQIYCDTEETDVWPDEQ